MTADDEIVHAHLTTTGRIAQRSMDKLKAHNPDAWEATMRLLQAGGLLTVKSTASLAGVRVLAIDLIVPNGDSLNLMTIEFEDEQPTLN